ncbi:MAG TPA: hypothetical protein DCM62_07930 [Bacteroidales bacterium]|nr:hypothetical protein [Bacteroidales bacterium]
MEEIVYLQMGQNIVSQNDALKKITLAEFARLIKTPNPQLSSKIEQLRTVQLIDKKRYQALKKMLPYVTCGIFNPQYRRTENFASVQCFILDIDHLVERGFDMATLQKRLQGDDRVCLMYVSPGNDGLKLLFLLAQKCYDHAQYALFYKIFAARFSQQYDLGQSVDKVTSDVTRACFLSSDQEAWYNPNAIPVKMASFIDFENYASIAGVQSELKTVAESVAEKQISEVPMPNKEIPSDLLKLIKEKLNPNLRIKAEKQIFVPEEVTAVVDKVAETMEGFGIKTKNVESIHYGKKFVFELDYRWAQLNLFYGKRGFKIVKTPATGSNDELAEVAYRILCDMFF